MEEIKKLRREIQQLAEQIEAKRKEVVKQKLKFLSQNEDDVNAHLTEEEWELLKGFLIEQGDCTSVKMQHSWYDDIDGFDTNDYDTIIRIGNKYLVIHDGMDQGQEYYGFRVDDKIDVTHKNLQNGEYDMSISKYDSKESFIINGIDFVPDVDNGWNGITQVIGGKGELTKPLDIDKLFEIDRRQEFEKALSSDNVVDYFLSKTPEELEEQFGPDVARMVGFEQNNSHHCYDLWEHTLRTVEGITREQLSRDDFIKMRVAAFFHDIGKPDVASFNSKTGQQVFYGHAQHSADVAKPILEKLGYSEEEIAQLSFYIAHHDDFISYKSELPSYMQHHEFVREIDEDTVAEKIIENKYDFEAMGYNKDQIRAIVYTLAHGKEPDFRTKDGPISIPVDMEEVKTKMMSGEYSPSYDATKQDYHMLLQLCMADAGAQSEEAKRKLPNGKTVKDGSKKEKLQNMFNIDIAYRPAYDKVEEIIQLIPESVKKAVEQNIGYSFEQFIKDSIPQALGEKRPVAVCKDGTEYSIQASSFHYCTPQEDGLEAYEEYEIGQITDWETGNLKDFAESEGGVAGFVPVEVIKEILKSHGGLDREKMLERIKEQKAIYQPRDDAYEKMIHEASGGNEFLEKMLRYATRRVEVRDTEAKAKQLSEEYEEQLPKDQHSFNDND